ATNYRQADISARQRAMLDFAVKVCEEPWAVDESDHAELAEHGFDDEDAWDIAAITVFFGLSNRMAHISGMIPHPEFHLLGRVPHELKRDYDFQHLCPPRPSRPRTAPSRPEPR